MIARRPAFGLVAFLVPVTVIIELAITTSSCNSSSSSQPICDPACPTGETCCTYGGFVVDTTPDGSPIIQPDANVFEFQIVSTPFCAFLTADAAGGFGATIPDGAPAECSQVAPQ